VTENHLDVARYIFYQGHISWVTILPLSHSNRLLTLQLTISSGPDKVRGR
jgi:hypothetical protein